MLREGKHTLCTECLAHIRFHIMQWKVEDVHPYVRSPSCAMFALGHIIMQRLCP